MEASRIGGRGVEWDTLRTVLAHHTRTVMGRDRALGAAPLTDPPSVRRAVELTREGRAALASGGAPPLDGIPDIRVVMSRCRTDGSVLDGTELTLVRQALQAVPGIGAYGAGVRELAPTVHAMAEALPRLPQLRERLEKALEDDGGLSDSASPRLGRLRRELRSRRRRVVQDLERMLQSTDAERIFADRFVTVRHGRYVLPVRAEARARVRGIVHDRSQSGQTLFVEPEAAVDANNELVELVREEEEESARVLGELTDGVREDLEPLEALLAGVAELDWIFARAATAERMRATAPVVSEERRVSVRAARHPLLVVQSWAEPTRPVVPIDLELSADRPILVITGPNAGGKTIALKTLGLLALMAQTGCHIPAAEGSRLPIFDAVYAIIGDDQSVAENLSTFSAFVAQAREILAVAGSGSLVLLDELGAGTDPDEGAALAHAILEALAVAGALVIASTHLEPLKAFATTDPRARNASVEFDTDRLAPTFRLGYDRPGQSYALAIAARLGLAADLITRAQAHRSADAARTGELLARLDADARRAAEHALAVEAREVESRSRLEAARDAEAQARGRAREILDRAKAEAAGLLGDVRRAINAEWERLRGERSKQTLEESRRRLRAVSARIETSAAPPTGVELAALRPGSRVRADHLGLRGEILAIAGDTATVRSGSITARVPVSALRPEGAAESRRNEVGVPAPATSRAHVTVPAGREIGSELLLLGRTTDEAQDMLEQYLDDAFLAGLSTVRVIHGKGTGALRKTVRGLLASHPLVASFRDGEPSEGGAGATVAQLKVS